MSIIKPKQETKPVEQPKDVAPINLAAAEDGYVQPIINALFVPKTERAANLILLKLNDIIKDLKIEIANAEPRYDDLDTYIEALKSDLVNVVMMKNHFKKQY